MRKAIIRICKVENCDRNITALGYCHKHYDAFKTHGDPLIQKQVWGEQRGKNPLFTVYNHMKDRCYNVNSERYCHYGGRGIIVCERWLGPTGFNNFCKDMGPKPTLKHSIERNDVNGNYESNNCRWANQYTQTANSRRNNVKPGVNFREKHNKFRAYITINKKQISLGYYDKFEDAVKARVDAEVKYKVYETN